MRMLKLFLISVVVLFLILTAFSSLLPSRVRISRAMDIADSSKIVRQKLQDLKAWVQWNEYIIALPQKTSTHDNISSKELSVSLIDTSEELIKTKWKQQNGKTFPGFFRLINHGSVTTVQWYFEFTIKWYPWEKFGSIIYDKQLGPPMEKSLNNLKRLIEKEP